MQSIKSVIVRLLLFFYLSSSFASATHFHNNALEQDNCKVCIVVKNLHSSDAPQTQPLLFECCFYPTTFYTKEESQTKTILKGFNANAPPYFS